MEIEDLKKIYIAFPGAEESIKWENDLCACVGEKMFLVINIADFPTSASFKTSESKYTDYLDRQGFKPAPYLARYHWIQVEDIRSCSFKEWEEIINDSYELVKNKLAKKLRVNL